MVLKFAKGLLLSVVVHKVLLALFVSLLFVFILLACFGRSIKVFLL